MARFQTSFLAIVLRCRSTMAIVHTTSTSTIHSQLHILIDQFNKMVAAVSAPVARFVAGSAQLRRGAAIKATAPMRVARRSAVKCMAVSRVDSKHLTPTFVLAHCAALPTEVLRQSSSQNALGSIDCWAPHRPRLPEGPHVLARGLHVSCGCGCITYVCREQCMARSDSSRGGCRRCFRQRWYSLLTFSQSSPRLCVHTFDSL